MGSVQLLLYAVLSSVGLSGRLRHVTTTMRMMTVMMMIARIPDPAEIPMVNQGISGVT